MTTGAVAVIVAHPDDETLWAGGMLLLHPAWRCRIVTLCRGSDADRAPKFRRALQCYRAEGEMADVDDGPEQAPLPAELLEETVLRLLGPGPFDLLLTHGANGEYTTHRRHDEVSRTVRALRAAGRIHCGQLCCFAYEDGGRAFISARARTLPYLLSCPRRSGARNLADHPRNLWLRPGELGSADDAAAGGTLQIET